MIGLFFRFTNEEGWRKMTCIDQDELKSSNQLRDEIDICVDNENYEEAARLKKILDLRYKKSPGTTSRITY